MAQTGFHAYIATKLRRYFPSKKWFFPSFLAGSIFPDLDYIFSQMDKLIYVPNYLSYLNKTFTHSLITTIIIYFAILILYEIKKNKNIINIANGLISGILLHIIFDIFLNIERIDLFWPLPIKSIHLWKEIIIPDYAYKFSIILELIFFRIFANYAISIILNHPGKNNHIIKFLTNWMKINIYFIILLIICSYLVDIKILLTLFFIIHMPSTLLMFYTIIKIWDSLDCNPVNKENKVDKIIKERKNLINID
tara:strand:+ start:892 stop:1644 length:753 start_codon:yes stop_codon:yes gene_type:complete